jgi:hypothetical protein
MNLVPKQSSPWMAEFDRQARIGKHVVLHGLVNDSFLLTTTPRPGGEPQSRYVTVHQFLEEYFKTAGYEVIGRYDFVDGLVFAEESMRARFSRLMNSTRGGDRDGQTAAELSLINNESEEPHKAINEALSIIRHGLAQQNVACAFVIDYADRLFSHPEHVGEHESPRLVQIKKMAQEAQLLRDNHPLSDHRNTLVLIAGYLGRLPA